MSGRLPLGDGNTSTPIVKRSFTFKTACPDPDESTEYPQSPEDQVIDDSMRSESIEKENLSAIQIDESLVSEIADSFAELSTRDENAELSDRSRSQLSPIKFQYSPSPKKAVASDNRSKRSLDLDEAKTPEPVTAAGLPPIHLDNSLFSASSSSSHHNDQEKDVSPPRSFSPPPQEPKEEEMTSPKYEAGGFDVDVSDSDEELVITRPQKNTGVVRDSDYEDSVSPVSGTGVEKAENRWTPEGSDSESDLVIRRKRRSRSPSAASDQSDSFLDDSEEASKSVSAERELTPSSEGGSSIVEILSDDEIVELPLPTRSEAPVDRKVKQRLEEELAEAFRKMESLERLRTSSNIASAPDGGLKLMTALSAAQEKIKILTEKLSNMPEPVAPKVGIKEKIAAGSWLKPLSAVDKDWAKAPQTPEAAASAKPWTMPNAEQISWKRAFADGHFAWPQLQFHRYIKGKHLFGGVMTAERMYQAKHITMTTVTSLHKSLQTIPSDSDLTEDPRGLRNVTLMRHQQWGLTWMLWRELQSPAGGILADDMGLGKTLSIISLILKRRQQLKENPLSDQELQRKKSALKNAGLRDSNSTLVIAPASVANQWKSEIEKRTKHGRLRALVYHGPGRKKHNHISLIDYDVVITTYDVIASEVGPGTEKEEKDSEDEELPGRHSSPIMKVAWERIVLDEAHMVKNYSSRRAKAIFRIPGTPIHNRLKDLYALVKFLRLSPLDEISVWNEWVERESKISKDRLNSIVKAIILRRTKDQVCTLTKKALVELPARTEVVHELDLKPGEREIYEQLFRASQLQAAQYLHSAAERTDDLRQNNAATSSLNVFKLAKAGSDDNFAQMLVLLLRLRQAAVHLHLIRDGVEVDGLELDAATVSSTNSPEDLADSIANLSIDEEVLGAVVPEEIGLRAKDLFEPEWSSTKMDALVLEIRKIQEGPGMDKIVIVSQWTSVLQKIVLPKLRGLRDIRVTEITGQVPTNQRQERVDAFNKPGKEPSVMLLSLTAGGVGLNLTGANHLFILDLHWNPALEKQAMDRIYRMGQIKPVFIHKFVCKRTIEVRVNELQKSKTTLANTVLSGAVTNNLSKLTLNDMRMLFELDGPEPGSSKTTLFDKQKFVKPQPKSIYAPRP